MNRQKASRRDVSSIDSQVLQLYAWVDVSKEPARAACIFVALNLAAGMRCIDSGGREIAARHKAFGFDRAQATEERIHEVLQAAFPAHLLLSMRSPVPGPEARGQDSRQSAPAAGEPANEVILDAEDAVQVPRVLH